MTPAPGRIPGWEGRDEEGWAEWLGCPVLELHRELPSTNDRAKALARGGAPPFTVVVAGAQSRGRGRGGKVWHSPQGGGLWISVLLAGDPGKGPGVLPLAVGVAGARALEGVIRAGAGKGVTGVAEGAGVRVAVKWPNDLLLETGERVGKVGGILCEAAGSRVVAGIGINLRRPAGALPEEVARGASFLDDAVDAVPPPLLARELLAALREWADPLPGHLPEALAKEWRGRDRLLGREVVCEAGPRGMAGGIGPDGALLVRLPEGTVIPVRGGSVRLARDEAERPLATSGSPEGGTEEG